MATTNEPKPNGSPEGSGGEKEKRDDQMFECNICLDTAKDAVVSMCGHVFCWPCIHTRLLTRPNRQVCPVCKAGINKERVIPIYGRGSTMQDPRNKVPSQNEPEGGSFLSGSSVRPDPYIFDEPPSATEMYNCDICLASFRHMSSLSRHKKVHEGRTTCEFCQRTYSSEEYMRKHILLKHIN